MDYMTKPLSRIAIRHLSKYVRKIFDLNYFLSLKSSNRLALYLKERSILYLKMINCLLMYLPGAILSLKVDL